jgi:hypothetical protein
MKGTDQFRRARSGACQQGMSHACCWVPYQGPNHVTSLCMPAQLTQLIIYVLLGCQEHGQCISACHISVCKAESNSSITQGNSGRSQKSAVFCSNTDQAYTSHGQPFQPATAISVCYHQLFFHTCKHHGSCTLAGDSHATLLLNVQLVDKVFKIEMISTFQATPLASHCNAEPGKLAKHYLLPIDGQHGQVSGFQRA